MNHLRFAADLPVTLTAEGQALPQRFNGVAYSGRRVPGQNCIIDLGTVEVAARMPLLVEHDRGRVAGVVEVATVASHSLTVSGRLFSDMADSDAERIAQLATKGAIYQMSVGVYAFTEQVVSVGEAVAVNGASHPGPVVVLRKGKIREVSIVVLGADHGSTLAMFSAGTRPTAGVVLSPQAYFAKAAREAAEFRARQAGRATR